MHNFNIFSTRCSRKNNQFNCLQEFPSLLDLNTTGQTLQKASKHNTIIFKCGINNGGRERNVLFNDALNTFYLRLYGVRHMVKDHSDSEKGNLLLPHRLLLSINSKGSFICTISHRITHTMAFVTPVVEHWLE